MLLVCRTFKSPTCVSLAWCLCYGQKRKGPPRFPDGNSTFFSASAVSVCSVAMRLRSSLIQCLYRGIIIWVFTFGRSELVETPGLPVFHTCRSEGDVPTHCVLATVIRYAPRLHMHRCSPLFSLSRTSCQGSAEQLSVALLWVRIVRRAAYGPVLGTPAGRQHTPQP